MKLVNTKKMLSDARKNNYAIGAYNIFNLETIKGVISAVKEMNVPVILQASESAVSYAGAKNLVNIIQNEISNITTPVALHLDHGKNLDIIKECIQAGFTSVMIDASNETYENNIELTKKVVSFAHKHNVTVEAELGELKGVEDNVSSDTAHLTNPTQAIDFIKKTKVDSLAVSIGTAHGINKGLTAPKIHFEILDELEQLLPSDFPLVCHGASSVDDSLQSLYISSGGVLTNAQGTNLEDLHKMATTTPISKINVDTDLRLVFTGSLRNSLNLRPETFNPRTHLKEVMQAIKNRVILTSTKIFK